MHWPDVVSTAASPQVSRVTIERLMCQVVESAPNGVALTRGDGRIVLVNAELERMFGICRDELLDSPIDELIPTRFRAGHAKLREGGAHAFMTRSMGAGRELVGLRANGTEFPIEVGINALQSPDGMMLVETIIDISVRKRLERMFQRIVEATPCGIVMVDAQGRIVMVNPLAEDMFGYTRAELIGNSLEMLLPERLRTEHGMLRQAFAAAPAIRHIGVDRDLTALRKDGSEFPVEIALNPVPAEDGTLVLALVTDITRRNAVQLELRRANANLAEFTYAASHDLKSPLRGIADLVSWIVDDLEGTATPEVKRNLGRISNRVQRLTQVIDDLLAYAHAGTASSEVVSVDLRELVGGVLELLPRPQDFHFLLQIDVKPFMANKAPLESVLRNLIGNAVKHHDRSAAMIKIIAKEVGQYCVVTISDDGPGIPSDCQERVFRMFQTLAAGGGGHAGVGLALSKRLVEVHGGRIELDSRAGERGTAFHVWWPRSPVAQD